MIRNHFLFCLLTAFLIVGYVLSDLVRVPAHLFPVLVLAALLSLVGAVQLRRKWAVLSAYGLFFVVLGLLRAPLPDVGVSALLPPAALVWGRDLSHSLLLRIRSVGLPTDETALLEALLLGVRTNLPQHLKQLYRLAGASHLLALSGLHLGILFGFLHFFLHRLTGSRWRIPLTFLSIALMWTYVMLTGFPISLCRASLMFTLYFLGLMRGAGNDSLHNLGLAALVILLFMPSTLYDVSFQLSFAAVAGILLFFSPLSGLWQYDERQPRPLRWLWNGWAVAFSAQLGVLPLLLLHFHYLSFWGILFSPFYVLLTTVILLVAILLLLLHAFGIASWLSAMLLLAMNFQHDLMPLTLRLPFSHIEVTAFPFTHVVLLYAALLCLLPSLAALQPGRDKSTRHRLALFFRTWPYLLSFIVLLFGVIFIPR